MIPRTVAELAESLHAQTVGVGSDTSGIGGEAAVTSVVVDSRTAGPGALFVALPGERVDGHDFVVTALRTGATAALVQQAVPGAGPQLVVPDPLSALGRIAREQVDLGRAGGLQVVAMTGSQGKTSTKDLLGQVLEPVAATIAPAGNYNNEIGLPLTIARIDAGTRFLVAEMGARGVGHIAYLCEIAPPQVGIVLNVGTAHLGEFGGREAIAQAKGELVEALPSDGVAVLNADDPYVVAMASRTRARVWWTSSRGDPGGELACWAGAVETDDRGRPRFTLRVRVEADLIETDVQLAVSGRHQVDNALAAAAAARALGVSSTDVQRGLASAGPRSRWRMELHERPDGVLVVNDAYNANPESVRAAISTSVEVAERRRGRAYAVLGDMLELGTDADAAHREIGAFAARQGVAGLVAVGDFAAELVAGATSAENRIPARAVQKVDAAAAVAQDTRAGDVILVKASRGLALDNVAEELLITDSAATGDRDGRSRS